MSPTSKNFIGLSSFEMLAMFRRGLFYAYLSIYLRQYLGLTVTETTLFATLPMAVNILCQTFVWGRVSDRLQLRRTLIIIGEIVAGVGTMLVWYVHRVTVLPITAAYVIIFGLSIIEIFWSMSNIAWSALISDIYHEKERSLIQGKLASLGGLGRMAGIWIGGLLYDGLGNQFAGWGFFEGSLFWVASGAMWISTLPLFFLPEGGCVRATGKTGVAHTLEPHPAPLVFATFLVSMVFVHFGRNSIAITLSQYLALPSGLAVGSRELSYIFNTQSAAMILFGWLTGWISRRIGNHIALALGTAVGIIALVILAHSTSLPLIYLSNFLRGVTDVVIMASSYTIASVLIPAEKRGRLFALFNATLFLSWGLSGTLIAGPTIDLMIQAGSSEAAAYRVSFWIAAAITLVGLAIQGVVSKMKPQPSISLSRSLHQAMKRWSDRKAVAFYRGGRLETELTYDQLRRHSSSFADHLSGVGVLKGERVILFMEKSLSFIVAHLAVQQLGAVSIPLNPGFKKREMAYLLNDAQPRLIITEADKRDFLQSIDAGVELLTLSTRTPYQPLPFSLKKRAPLDPLVVADDPALIIYTSGTTGDPKGAILTQQNLVHDAANIIQIWQITEKDRLCHALPLFHVHGLCFALHCALLSGAETHMLDRFDPQLVLNMLSGENHSFPCTLFMAVPVMYSKMMDAMGERVRDFSLVRLLTSGSAPLPPNEFQRIKTCFGMEPVEREGMSETGMNFSNPLIGTRKPGSIGMPLPGLSVRIVDPKTFQDKVPGQIGEIWLKGPGITPGYWRKEKETHKAFAKGWFRTGDLGRVDADGYYYLTDRLKHIIITGGENVSASEVETVINQMDHVIESSVVGIPDETWGEKVVAAVVTDSKAHLDAKSIQTFCKQHLHAWKCPKEIRFVSELPRNTMGKILKEAVKSLFPA